MTRLSFFVTMGACALVSLVPRASEANLLSRVLSADDGRQALAPLSEDEKAALAEGESVKRSFSVMHENVHYHAGIVYRVVRANPLDVMRLLRAPRGLEKAIPYGIESRTLYEEEGVSTIRITQGKVPFLGSYTVRMRWDMSRYEARFWLDPSQKHDVRDLWGMFSARPIAPGLTLLRFGFCFDIGGVGQILESKAQRWGLTTADRIAKLLEGERN